VDASFDSSSVVDLANEAQINQHEEIAPPKDGLIKRETIRNVVD
jgi:hypothetical protein